MVKGIAHTAYMVTDMQKALDFYVAGFGFKHAFSLPDAEGRPWIEYLKVADDQFIELFHPAPGFAQGNKSYMHLCLEVDDCFAAAKELEARGLDIWAKPKVGTDHNVQCWTRDPDGNLIEIMQISPESPQAKCR